MAKKSKSDKVIEAQFTKLLNRATDARKLRKQAQKEEAELNKGLRKIMKRLEYFRRKGKLKFK